MGVARSNHAAAATAAGLAEVVNRVWVCASRVAAAGKRIHYPGSPPVIVMRERV